MIVDLNYLDELISATNARLQEAKDSMKRLESFLKSISTNDWDDKKKQEYTLFIERLMSKLSKSINETNDYVIYLNHKSQELRRGV